MQPVSSLSLRRKNRKTLGSTDKAMYLCSFLAPMLIVTLIYAASGVWPFGDKCFLKTDMYHQYAPFFSELRSMLHGENSLFYTFDVGMGVNFLSVIAYYLADPLNLLVALFPKGNVIEFMNIIMILKLSLSSLSFTFFLRQHFKREDAGFCFFGIAYSLSGYMCAYYWNIMWLSCIVLFPLIMLYMEELIKNGRVFPYAVLLAACIWTNYYISIMICIFLCFWFLGLNVLYPPKDVRDFLIRCAKFAVGSLAAGLFAGVLLLPAYYTLRLTASSDSSFPKTLKEYFPIADMLARMLPAVETEQTLKHWPNIYSGTFAFILMPLYVTSKKISIKEKTVYLSAAFLLLAGFSINYLDYIWHGFHFPNSLPCRESFIFVFLVLFMCARAYSVKRSFKRKDIGAAVIFAFIFIIYLQKGADEEYYKIYTFWAAMLFCALYAGCLNLYKNKAMQKQAVFIFAAVVLLWDVTVNASVTSFTTCSRTSYVKDNEDVRELYTEAESLRDSEDIYRFDRNAGKTKNDGAWLNIPTVSLFSSTADAGITDLFDRLGCEASTNSYSTTGSTPVVDALFNVKYGFYPDTLPYAFGKELIDTSEHAVLYKNLYSTAFGYVVPAAFCDTWIYEFDNPALVQNSMCDALSVPQALIEVTTGAVEKDKSFSVYAPCDGEYYAYCMNTSLKSVSASYGGKKTEFQNVDRGYFLELGELTEGEYVKIKPGIEDTDMRLKLYRVDYDAVMQFSEKLKEAVFAVTGHDGRMIEGVVNAPADGAELFLSIPFDEGWSCTVDGEEATLHEGLGSAFTGLTLSKGSHSITLKYRPQGLTAGLLATFIGILMLAVLYFADRRGRETLKAGKPALQVLSPTA